MSRIPPEVVHALARGSHELAPWFQEWRQRELDQLPFAAPNNVAILQGRCQVLTELYKIVQSSPDMAAQSRKG
jgi:hypothetical protein